MVEVARWALFAVGALGFGWWTWRRGSLTLDGAVAAVLLGSIVVLRAGAAWLLPLFVFFGSSSLIGKLFPAGRLAGDDKSGRGRDALQVICNGGVYGLLAWWGLDPVLLLVCMAVATADTWASEIGKYLRQPTYDVLRFRRVPPGLSGGVSAGGNAGGAAGAVVIAGIGFLLIPEYGIGQWLAVSLLGFGGMLLDSVLGAALQARYQDPHTGMYNDVRTKGAHLVSGFAWITNDLVNLLAIAGTVLLTLLIYGG